MSSRHYSANEFEYQLPADEQETKRLGIQHINFRRVLQRYDSWPIIVPSSYYFTLQPGDKVLDSGTGTAAWLIELASSFPPNCSITFDGIDMSSAQFPPPHSLHPAVTLSIHNVLSLPQEWSNRYILIHQRLFISALSRTQWKTNLHSLHRVLKPGGWLTLVEVGSLFAGLASAKVNQAYLLLFQNTDYLRDPIPVLHDWMHSVEWEGMFDKETIEMRSYKWEFGRKAKEENPEYARDIMTSTSRVFASLGPAILSKGGSGVKGLARDEEEWMKLIEDMVEEWQDIEEAYVEFRVLSARKSEE